MSKGPKSKGISARNRERETGGTPVQTPVSWVRRIRFALRFPALLAAGAFTIVIWIWLTRENPNQLLQEAKDVVAKNPALAVSGVIGPAVLLRSCNGSATTCHSRLNNTARTSAL